MWVVMNKLKDSRDERVRYNKWVDEASRLVFPQ